MIFFWKNRRGRSHFTGQIRNSSSMLEVLGSTPSKTHTKTHTHIHEPDTKYMATKSNIKW